MEEDRAPAATARTRFRRWAPEDAGFVVDMYGREEVYRFLGSAPSPITTEEQARERIARWSGLSAPSRGLWAIERTDDGPPRSIGTVLLGPLPRSDGRPTDAIEVGWHLHPDAWGRGLATEAAGSAVALARDTGVEVLRAVVFADNIASMRVCGRLGMVGTGPTTQWYGVELEEFRIEWRGRPVSQPDRPRRP